MKRITIPYIIWPILIFIENNIYYYIKYHHKKYSLKNLILQLLVGRKINNVFWFQFNLIFISVIILIVTFIFPEKLIYHFLILLAVYAYVFDLKEYNSKIFSQYNINRMVILFLCGFEIILKQCILNILPLKNEKKQRFIL